MTAPTSWGAPGSPTHHVNAAAIPPHHVNAAAIRRHGYLHGGTPLPCGEEGHRFATSAPLPRRAPLL